MSEISVNKKQQINFQELKIGLKKADLKTEAQQLIFDAINTNVIADDEIDLKEKSELEANFDTNNKKEITDEQILKFIKDKKLDGAGIAVEDVRDFFETWKESQKISVEPGNAQNEKFDKFFDTLALDDNGTYDKLLMLFDYDNDKTINANGKSEILNTGTIEYIKSEKEIMTDFLKDFTGSDKFPSKRDLKNLARYLNEQSFEDLELIKNYVNKYGKVPDSIKTELKLPVYDSVKLRKLKKEYEIAGNEEILNSNREFREMKSNKDIREAVEKGDMPKEESLKREFQYKDVWLKDRTEGRIIELLETKGNKLVEEKYPNSDILKTQVIKNNKGKIIFKVDYNEDGTINSTSESAKFQEREITERWSAGGFMRQLLDENQNVYWQQEDGLAVITTKFDEQGRIIFEENRNKSNNLIHHTKTIVYNEDGTYTETMTDLGDTTITKYNPNNQPLEEIYEVKIPNDIEEEVDVDAIPKSRRYNYDSNGNVISTVEYNISNKKIRELKDGKIIYYNEEGTALYYTKGETWKQTIFQIEDGGNGAYVKTRDSKCLESYKVYSMDGELIGEINSEREQESIENLKNVNIENSTSEHLHFLVAGGFMVQSDSLKAQAKEEIINLINTPGFIEKYFETYFKQNPDKLELIPKLKDYMLNLLETKSLNIEILYKLSEPNFIFESFFIDTPNGKIDKPRYQGQIGDCWLLETINSLARNPEGQKILDNLISVNKKTGDITVSFEGGKKKYLVTMKDMINSEQHSRGDYDLRAIEIATQRYISENPTFSNPYLEGGSSEDRETFMSIITGKKQLGNVENINGTLVAIDNTQKIEFSTENLEQLRHRPFLLELTKENMEVLSKFENLQIVVGATGHAYSMEFNKDGTLSLHEPHNSENTKIYTIDEILELDFHRSINVMLL